MAVKFAKIQNIGQLGVWQMIFFSFSCSFLFSDRLWHMVNEEQGEREDIGII